MTNLINGGFLIIKGHKKGEDMPLLPEKLRSGSECVCYQFPHPSLIEWTESAPDEKKEYLSLIGIKPNRADEATAWCTDNFEKAFGWQNVFYTLDAAKEAKDLFFKNDSGVCIFGLGLPEEYVQDYINFSIRTLNQHGDEPLGKSTTLEMLEKKQPLPEGSKFLGYELLSTEEAGMILHSHMCRGIENGFDREFGIKPNKDGFYDDLDTAKKCLDYANSPVDDDEDIVDEEAHDFWAPWAIVEYK